MSLYLIGLRGAGKSTAGRLAAARIGAPFEDTDSTVEARAGRSIRALFEAGERATFRRIEREVTLELLSAGGPARVVATGGGCVLDAEVRELLGRSPGTVWLTAPVEVLARRTTSSDRPSLTGLSLDEETRLLHAERELHYLAASRAGTRLDTERLSPLEVTNVLEHLWATVPHHDLR